MGTPNFRGPATQKLLALSFFTIMQVNGVCAQTENKSIKHSDSDH